MKMMLALLLFPAIVIAAVAMVTQVLARSGEGEAKEWKQLQLSMVNVK